MSRIEWPALMRAGLRGLGLAPEEFWALTPAELQLMLGNPASSGPLLSKGLEALMAAYPDSRDTGQEEKT
jgi:uncharacterized phage protein (TIGR02216 family)